MIDLSGKTALVTGGSGALGRPITEALVKAGAFVVFTFKDNVDRAWLTASKLVGPTGLVGALPLPLDVVSMDGEAGLNLAIKDRGGLDILVHCTGVNRPASFDQLTLFNWLTVIETNLTGAYNVMKAFEPVVKDGGSIVTVGSISGHIGGPTSAHYAASKAGLVALTQTVARYVAPRGIRVNVVAPGYIQSSMTEAGAQSEAVRKVIEQIPLGRLGQPEEVAGAVLFLASDLSRYITGQVIHVNGGLYFG